MEQIEVFNRTVRGFRHIQDGTVCEDASISFADPSQRFNIAAIADGHGDANCVRAQIGSKEAVQAALVGLTRFAKQLLEELDSEIQEPGQLVPRIKDILERDNRERAHLIRTMTDSIIADWYERIMRNLKENPLTEEEFSVAKRNADEYRKGIGCERAYGTTLIASLLVGDYLILLQQGDGRCIVFYEDDRVNEPVPWDDRCFSVYTTSMCDEDVSSSIRHCVINRKKNPILGCFVCSDGVEDAYGEDNLDARHNFCRERLCELDEWGKNLFEEKIEEFLSIHSREGSRDDVSIAGIVFKDAVRRHRKMLDEVVKRFGEEYRLQSILSECEHRLASMQRKHEYLRTEVERKEQDVRALEVKYYECDKALASENIKIMGLEDSISTLDYEHQRESGDAEKIIRDVQEKSYWESFRKLLCDPIRRLIDQDITQRILTPLQEQRSRMEWHRKHKAKLQQEFNQIAKDIQQIRGEWNKVKEEYHIYHERYSEIERRRDDTLKQLQELQSRNIPEEDGSTSINVIKQLDQIAESDVDETDVCVAEQHGAPVSAIELQDFRWMLSVCLHICKDVWKYSRENTFLAGISLKNIRISDKEILWPSDTVRINSEYFRFLPPECNANMQEFSVISNRYTMALLFFEFLTGKHPFEGAALFHNYSAQRKQVLYGREAAFVMDVENTSNRLNSHIDSFFYDRWNVLPQYIQDLFSRAFGRDAMEHPDHRPDELEWSKCLINLRNNILTCPACGREIMWAADHTAKCLHCGNEQTIMRSLEFSELEYQQVAVAHGKIYNIQITDDYPDQVDVVAKIVENPHNSEILGLYNVSNIEWTAYTLSGREKTVVCGEVVPLKPGIKIRIGNKQIVVK